jgi:hypothetical protein
MRAIWVASCLAITLALAVFASTPTPAAPGLGRPVFGHQIRGVQPIEDTCWWWGLRWQYGWRGYGWYPCVDWPKPLLPSAISPEASPPVDAPPPETCVQTWRDAAGNTHSRRQC